MPKEWIMPFLILVPYLEAIELAFDFVSKEGLWTFDLNFQNLSLLLIIECFVDQPICDIQTIFEISTFFFDPVRQTLSIYINIHTYRHGRRFAFDT
ncbi:hypothetical protein L6452_32513 [Arctium lappa]|uniref:Uncharacterized protein n=1 Tax=Arctium lappa TaxID=4217 RepID=A0ACB8Z3W6_ARCLA|nr:hypothetical protein L6452_32513 [Arctium lappa]